MDNNSGGVLTIIGIITLILIIFFIGRRSMQNHFELNIKQKGYYQLNETTRVYGSISNIQFIEPIK